MKLLVAAGTWRAAYGKEGPMFQRILEVAVQEKRSVTVFIGGHTLGGGVVEITSDTVELHSREYSRVVVRLDSIDAVALI